MSQKSRKNLKTPVRVALVGSSGRMGVHIAAVIAASDRFRVTHSIDGAAAWPKAADDVDVVIDFSQPAGLRAALAWCVKYDRPLVSGTTGFDDVLARRLRAAAARVPVLHSANMSPGIAVMSAMLERLRHLGDWDFHVDEIHHRHKRDAPSGTARLLDARLGEVLGRPTPKPNSVRGGSVPGLHQVWAMGEDEMLLLQHTAFDRRVFARGAVRAAGWLFDKGTPGFYDLVDLYTT